MQHCLFWVHATVSFFSSLADIAGATVLHSWERRRKSVEVEEEWEVKSEKRTSWECVHHGTTHKAHRCKRRHPSQDQVFDCLIVVRKKKGLRSCGPLCPDTVALTGSSHRVSSPCRVSWWDHPIHPSANKSLTRDLKSSHWGDICASFKLKKR